MQVTDRLIRDTIAKVQILTGEVGDPTKRAVRQGDMRSSVSRLDDANGLILQQLKVLQVAIDALAASVGGNTNDVTDLQTSVTALGSSLSAQQDDITSLQTDVSGLQDDVSAAQDDISAAEDKLSAAGAVTVGTLTASNLVAAPTAADYNKLVADLATLRTAIIALRGALA